MLYRPDTPTRLISGAVANMLLATFAFAVMNVFVKQLDRIPAMEIVFFRCLVSAAICFVGIARAGADWKGNNNALLIARGSFGTLALFTFFITVQNIPLATAVTIDRLPLADFYHAHRRVRARRTRPARAVVLLRDPLPACS